MSLIYEVCRIQLFFLFLYSFSIPLSDFWQSQKLPVFIILTQTLSTTSTKKSTITLPSELLIIMWTLPKVTLEPILPLSGQNFHPSKQINSSLNFLPLLCNASMIWLDSISCLAFCSSNSLVSRVSCFY